MESWIRYSVAVYVGLLLAGAAIYPSDVHLGPEASADTAWYYPPTLNDQPPLDGGEASAQALTLSVHQNEAAHQPLRWAPH